MAKTRIIKIDQLFDSTIATPIDQDNAGEHQAAVGIIQEMLTCHGYAGLPSVRSVRNYGKLNAVTLKNLKDFRVKNGLQQPSAKPEIDHWTLRRLALAKASSPRASRGYLALALDIEATGLVHVLSLVTLAEGAGKFSAFNANSDKKGLSYGIIQWAQKPGRLKDIVEKYQQAQPELFKTIFGQNADAMVAHTRKPNGGVDPTTGITTDPNFDLVNALWKNCFLGAAEDKAFQKVQVDTALAAFRDFITSLRTYAARPGLDTAKIKSQRGYAFMIDLGNQHGTTGARSIYQRVVTAAMSESEALAKLTEESVRLTRQLYPPTAGKDKSVFELATQDRRDFFRSTSLLTDTDFDEN